MITSELVTGTPVTRRWGTGARLALASITLAFGLWGCSSAPVIDEPVTTPQAPLIWPSPPEPARITYLRSISKPTDIGANKGFFRRLAELVVGATTDDMIKPYGVTVDARGRVIVVDTSFKRIHVYDVKSKEYLSIEEPGKEDFTTPIAAAADADGNIFVTDSGAPGVFVFSPGGKFLRSFEAGGRPTGIAINRKEGLVYVSDTAGHKVNIFGLDGASRGSFGALGILDGEFNYPVDLSVDADGMVYVIDAMNFRVQIFDKTGRFASKFGNQGDGTGDIGRPKGVAVDRDGHIYVADALFDTVQIFDREGNFLLNFGGLGRTAGNFWLPCGLFIDDGNKIYVGDSYNSRVQVFEYLGEGS